MLPSFDANGNLPPGLHRCTLDELEARFGHGSPERQVETSELRRFVEWARLSGIERILIDGSYTSAKAAPNDIDLVILPGSAYPTSAGSLTDAATQWPFLHVQVAVDAVDLDQWARVDFGTDRAGNPKGIAEIDL